MTPKILLLAGEASGDNHGAGVARALKARYPGGELVGIGGPLMWAEGVELLVGLEHLAVMGFVEVALRFRFFWNLERRIHKLLDSGTIDLVLPIDYPGFNLRVARAAHRRGIPVLYYIAPQVWAWKPGRAARLAEFVDRLAVILPFEAKIFEAAGAAVTFVGHPLLERAERETTGEEFRRRWGLHAHGPILALMPGSRLQEIDRHLDLFVRTVALVREQHPSHRTGGMRSYINHINEFTRVLGVEKDITVIGSRISTIYMCMLGTAMTSLVLPVTGSIWIKA